MVNFDGEECPGEIIEQHHGWVLARVLIDPFADFGEFTTSELAPVSQVMVRESDVRPME